MVIIMGMYNPHEKKKEGGTPPLHHPDRTVTEKARIRAAQRHRWDGMTPAQMCEAMDIKELTKNARRGGVAAIAELERREFVESLEL